MILKGAGTIKRYQFPPPHLDSERISVFTITSRHCWDMTERLLVAILNFTGVRIFSGLAESSSFDDFLLARLYEVQGELL